MTVPPEDKRAQKIANLARAVKALQRSATTPITEPRDMSGIVKDYEIAYELSWKTLKAQLETEGHVTSTAKDVFAQAYQLRKIQNQDVWLEMITDRNLTVHTYDETLAKELCERIRTNYLPVFEELLQTIQKK